MGPDRCPDRPRRRARALFGPFPQRGLLPVAEQWPVYRRARVRDPRPILDDLAGRNLAEPAMALGARLLSHLRGLRSHRPDGPLRRADHGAARTPAVALSPEGVADAGRRRDVLLPGSPRGYPSAGGGVHGADLHGADRAAGLALGAQQFEDRAAACLVGAPGDSRALCALGESARRLHRRAPAPGPGDGRHGDRQLARHSRLGPALPHRGARARRDPGRGHRHRGDPARGGDLGLPAELPEPGHFAGEHGVGVGVQLRPWPSSTSRWRPPLPAGCGCDHLARAVPPRCS